MWAQAYGTSVHATPLEGDIQTGVLVVGAGISGALMAHTLVHRGHDVTIVDRREPVHGSTLASTALLQFEIDLPLTALSDRIGRAKAVRAWQRSAQAVQALTRIVRTECIRCGFAPRQSVYLAGNAYGSRALRREAEARARAGIAGSYLDRASLARGFGLDRTGAIVSEGSAAANPAQLTAGLLRRCVAAGARIHSPVDIAHVHSDRRGVALGTAGGAVIAAQHAVFCTGYELLKELPLAGHRVKSTWAIAMKSRAPLPSWLSHTLVWEASDPYLYLRSIGDGRLIAGGEDEDSGSRHLNGRALDSKAHRIASNVHALLPGVRGTVTHRWAGAFGESPTGLPILGRVPGRPRCHVVAGFGGNGITYSVIGAEVIAGHIDGVRDPDADLFRAPQ